MKRSNALPVVIILACISAVAQADNPHNGKWRAAWEGTMEQQHTVAAVVILDTGGTFQHLRKSSSNPCVGRKAPITVQTATADELIFVVEFSTVLKGCKDNVIKVKRVDDRTLKGLKDEKREITLTKE